MKKIISGLMLTFLSLPAYSQGLSIDLLLKARGLQATEKIDSLVKKNGDSKGKNLSPKEHCEWALEGAYFAFATPSLSGIVTKKSEGKSSKKNDTYTIILREEDSKLLQLTYSYDSKDKSYIGAAVVDLPDDWKVGFIPTLENTITLVSPKCIYVFSPQESTGKLSDTDW